VKDEMDGASIRPAFLATKICVPPGPPNVIPRPRLIAALDEGVRRRLVHVAAPAGSGKTTLLATWAHQVGLPVAWVTLDADDNDPARFWRYVVAALERQDPRSLEVVRVALASPQTPSDEALLVPLLNALATGPGEGVLVLDDYHEITATAIHRALTYLVEHLPPRQHLVIAGRSDPPLPLARLRARGELTEIRAAELRFSPEEAGSFLQQTMGLDLPAETSILLTERTEGWIAGLQLAGLALRGRHDDPRFIADFRGTHRYVVDYLLEEVLRRQSETVQAFVLQTAILDRLSGPLCDAVTGRSDSQAMLEALERSNLFVHPLDDERHWYRYHQLFAEALRHHQNQANPALTPRLHQRAAAWYEREGLLGLAIGHAIAGADVARAVRLVEASAEPLVLRGEGATLLGWLAALPDEVRRERHRLALDATWALVFTNQLDLTEQWLQDLEKEIDRPTATVEEALPVTAGLKAEIVAIRALVASQHRDVTGTIALSQKALESLPARHPHRAVLALTLGYAHSELGDAAAVDAAFAEAAAVAGPARNLLVATIAASNRGQLKLAQGRLRAAAELQRQALRLLSEKGAAEWPLAGVAEIGLGLVFCEWNNLEAAARHVLAGVERGSRLGSVVVELAGDYALARLRWAEGDLASALAALDRGRERLAGQRVPNWGARLDVYRARLWLARGDIDTAVAWAEEREQASPTAAWPVFLAEQLTLARLWLARGRPEEAAKLLAPLRRAIEQDGRTGNPAEILMLEAVASQMAGKASAATSLLAQALALTTPERHVRLFLDEGPPLGALLRQALERSATSDSVVGLLHAIDAVAERKLLSTVPDWSWSGPSGESRAGPPRPPLAEPLSPREREVLRLLAAGRSNREIAEAFVVSQNTVRTQVKSIYGKLGVHGRADAASVARTLRLL
jgi:LuxR family maltose regulon positive regulatory protein